MIAARSPERRFLCRRSLMIERRLGHVPFASPQATKGHPPCLEEWTSALVVERLELRY